MKSAKSRLYAQVLDLKIRGLNVASRLCKLASARKITSVVLLSKDPTTSHYYKELNKVSYPGTKSYEALTALRMRTLYDLLVERTFAAETFAKEQEEATYETCQRTRVQVEHGIETLEEILAWARENGYITVPTVPGDCPMCACKEAHAFNGEVVECRACGFQHIPGVPIAATVEHAIEERAVSIKDAGLMTLKDVPLYIKEIIWSKVQAVPAPMYFSIKGTPGGGTDTSASAHTAFEKLRKWCESIGAEVNVIRDGYREHYRTGQGTISAARLIVEITDPAARFLEEALEKIHGKFWKVSAPKDPYEWRWLKEQGKLPV